MRATRRGLMLGALAVPTVAGLASWRWRNGFVAGEGSVLLHDPTLGAGRRFGEAGRAAGGRVVTLEGDPIRLAQTVLQPGPALVAGVSRHAEALLFAEAAGEAGYLQVAAFVGDATGCGASDCRDGWRSLGRMAERSGSGWIEALAMYAAQPESSVALPRSSPMPGTGSGRVFGWVLAREA